MDGRPILAAVARALREHGLEAVLIGNPDDDTLQLDFMTAIHGPASFNAVRARATQIELEGEKLLVASLADIIASKRAAARPRDQAVLHVLEATLKQKQALPPQSPRSPESGV